MPAIKPKAPPRTRKRLLKRKIRPRDWFLDPYIRQYATEVNSNASRLKWHISSGYPMRKEVMDRQTGEIESWMTGRFRQKSKPASPGVQLRTREVIKDWHMDKIILAGGAGKETLKTIRKELMRFMPIKLRRGRQQEFSGYFKNSDDDDYAD